MSNKAWRLFQLFISSLSIDEFKASKYKYPVDQINFTVDCTNYKTECFEHTDDILPIKTNKKYFNKEKIGVQYSINSYYPLDIKLKWWEKVLDFLNFRLKKIDYYNKGMVYRDGYLKASQEASEILMENFGLENIKIEFYNDCEMVVKGEYYIIKEKK